MIVARTPLRISLAGGGTDLPWYADKYGGLCVTAAIDKYVYVSLSRRYRGPSLIHYRDTETSYAVHDIKHPIIREVLREYPIPTPFELHTTADIDSNSGLGSSSAFTVCLLRAVAEVSKRSFSRIELAEKAYHIEHDILGSPIGRQDAYACALEGILSASYDANGAGPLYHQQTQDACNMVNNLLLFDTGVRRDANVCLGGQKKRAAENVMAMHAVKEDAHRLLDKWGEGYGETLRAHWARKRQLADGMTDSRIDEGVETCVANGAEGAKLVGAGGGGFILAYAPDNRECVIAAMTAKGFRHVPFRLDWGGLTVMLNTERT